MPPLLRHAALLTWSAMLAGNVHGAQAAACAPDGLHAGPALNLQVDNDVLGAQDQGYSSGVQLTLVSSNLARHENDTCRWGITRWLASQLQALKPQAAEQQNLLLSLSQGIFTPANRRDAALVRNDRPYAATLLAGLGYNARTGNRLQASALQIGIVGPSARGRQTQEAIHKVTGDETFRGWQNQLGDEGVFRLLHERLQRHSPATQSRQDHDAWDWDAVTHWGASVGNLATYANAGGELRLGSRLPDDFGSSPVRPADEPTLPSATWPPDRPFAAHAFTSMDVRWVLRDITLDGNAFRMSHRVDKRAFVADFGYGFALSHGPWKLVLARFHRTREFKGQKDLPVYGSVSVSRTF